MAKKATFQLPMEIDIVNPIANLDARYGPYASIADALAGVPISLRKQGRTVGIVENGKVVDYCWSEGTADNQLVPKVNMSAIETELASKADKSTTYTKTEIDNKLTAVYTVKGNCTNAEVPTKAATAKIGDVYNLTDNGVYGNKGDNIVYIGPVGSTEAGAWDNLGQSQHQVRTFTVRAGQAGQLQPLFSLGNGNNPCVLMQYVVSVRGNRISDELHYAHSYSESDDSFYTNTHVTFVEHRATSFSGGPICLPCPETVSPFAVTTITLTVIAAGCEINWYDQNADLLDAGNYDRPNACIVQSQDLTGAIELHTNEHGDILDNEDQPVASLTDDTLYTMDAAASGGLFELPVRAYVDTRIFCYGSGTVEYNGDYYNYQNADMLWPSDSGVYIESGERDYYTRSEMNDKLALKYDVSKVSKTALTANGLKDSYTQASDATSSKAAVEEACNSLTSVVPDAVVTYAEIASGAYALIGWPDFSASAEPQSLHKVMIDAGTEGYAVLQYKQVMANDVASVSVEYLYGSLDLYKVTVTAESGAVLDSIACKANASLYNHTVRYRWLQYSPILQSDITKLTLPWHIATVITGPIAGQTVLVRNTYGARQGTSYVRHPYNGLAVSTPTTSDALQALYNPGSGEGSADADNPLCITAIQATTIDLSSRLLNPQYKINDGAWTYVTDTLSLQVGDKLYLRADAAGYALDVNMTCTGKVSLSGCLASLNEQPGLTSTICQDLFAGWPVVYAHELQLYTPDVSNCFRRLLFECTELLTAPNLPYMQLTANCYQQMFSGCSKLQIAPELPATVLPDSAYYRMFMGCSALLYAPALPASAIPARTSGQVGGCYTEMFRGCSNLKYAKISALSWPYSPTYNWLQGVAASGTLVIDNDVLTVGTATGQIPSGSANGIPTGWTVSPSMSANQLAAEMSTLHTINDTYKRRPSGNIDMDGIERHMIFPQDVSVSGINLPMPSGSAAYGDWLLVAMCTSGINGSVDASGRLTMTSVSTSSHADAQISSTVQFPTLDFSWKLLRGENAATEPDNGAPPQLIVSDLTCIPTAYKECKGETVAADAPTWNFDPASDFMCICHKVTQAEYGVSKFTSYANYNYIYYIFIRHKVWHCYYNVIENKRQVSGSATQCSYWTTNYHYNPAFEDPATALWNNVMKSPAWTYSSSSSTDLANWCVYCDRPSNRGRFREINCQTLFGDTAEHGVTALPTGTRVMAQTSASASAGMTQSADNATDEAFNNLAEHLELTDPKIWDSKAWSGLTSFSGQHVWSDGTNIYYSNDTDQYVLDKATSTWSAKTWSGLTSFSGQHVWSDGTNIYYLYESYRYVLDKETSTWSVKTWSGLYATAKGQNVWTDGTDIYLSSGSNQYVLDKSTSTWTTKTWTGLTNYSGQNVWTDGTNIYCSTASDQYVLNKATSTWSAKTWIGLTSFNGSYVWTDGTDIYLSSGSNQYVLDKSTSTWTTKTWTGLSNFNGQKLWTDGTTTYYSDSGTQFVLNLAILSDSEFAFRRSASDTWKKVKTTDLTKRIRQDIPSVALTFVYEDNTTQTYNILTSSNS